MDGASSRGTHIASSATARRWRKGALAQGQGNPWYIAYLEGHLTVMRVVGDRDEAIGVACAMLDEGIDVISVGPMLGVSEQKIDRESLQEICRQRRRVEMWNETVVTALAAQIWAAKPRGEGPLHGLNRRTAMSAESADLSLAVSTPRLGLTRRGFIGASLGLTAAGLVMPGVRGSARAANYPALGTFPAGVQGSDIFIGLITPLTGPYASSGQDMQKGFELAVAHLNNGSRITEAVASLKKAAGLLSKKIQFQVADSQTQPDPSIEAATRFIHDNHAIMLTGGVSSAVSIALEKLGQRDRSSLWSATAAPMTRPAKIASASASARSCPPIWPRRPWRQCWPRSSAKTARPPTWSPIIPMDIASTTR
jgi:Periplasmic binding protein